MGNCVGVGGWVWGGGKGLFVLVEGGNTVGAWALLAIATMGLVGEGMEVVGREHEGHSQEESVT